MLFYGAQHFTEVLKDLLLLWYEGIRGSKAQGERPVWVRETSTYRWRWGRPVPGHQLAVMEQKEKAEIVLLESEKEATCQDHTPTLLQKKRKQPKPR